MWCSDCSPRVTSESKGCYERCTCPTSSLLAAYCNLSLCFCRKGSQDAELPAHKGTVVALTVDASNRALVTAGLDGVLRIWDFRRQKLTGVIPAAPDAAVTSTHRGRTCYHSLHDTHASTSATTPFI